VTTNYPEIDKQALEETGGVLQAPPAYFYQKFPLSGGTRLIASVIDRVPPERGNVPGRNIPGKLNSAFSTGITFCMLISYNYKQGNLFNVEQAS
jgi:hypothetical protein